MSKTTQAEVDAVMSRAKFNRTKPHVNTPRRGHANYGHSTLAIALSHAILKDVVDYRIAQEDAQIAAGNPARILQRLAEQSGREVVREGFDKFAEYCDAKVDVTEEEARAAVERHRERFPEITAAAAELTATIDAGGP
jgi:hypothetical protein